MPYGFSKYDETVRRKVTLQTPAAAADVEPLFEPYRSMLLHLSEKGEITPLDCRYHPPIPEQSLVTP